MLDFSGSFKSSPVRFHKRLFLEMRLALPLGLRHRSEKGKQEVDLRRRDVQIQNGAMTFEGIEI